MSVAVRGGLRSQRTRSEDGSMRQGVHRQPRHGSVPSSVVIDRVDVLRSSQSLHNICLLNSIHPASYTMSLRFGTKQKLPGDDGFPIICITVFFIIFSWQNILFHLKPKQKKNNFCKILRQANLQPTYNNKRNLSIKIVSGRSLWTGPIRNSSGGRQRFGESVPVSF